uniref:Uncharacterized protein n=1 Tax=Arundo donax TaxID=35708 RepID=A0A0A9CD23_ARUDO
MDNGYIPMHLAGFQPHFLVTYTFLHGAIEFICNIANNLSLPKTIEAIPLLPQD